MTTPSISRSAGVKPCRSKHGPIDRLAKSKICNAVFNHPPDHHTNTNREDVLCFWGRRVNRTDKSKRYQRSCVPLEVVFFKGAVGLAASAHTHCQDDFYCMLYVFKFMCFIYFMCIDCVYYRFKQNCPLGGQYIYQTLLSKATHNKYICRKKCHNTSLSVQ